MIVELKEKPSERMTEILRERFTVAGKHEFGAAASVGTNATGSSDAAREGDAETRQLRAAEPQPIYTSTIDALLGGRLLDDAYLSGWQYVLISEDDEPQGVVEFSQKPEGELPRTFDVLRSAEFAQALNDVILRAEEIEGAYELRMLRVPSIYLVAVWLKSGDRNLLLPVVPPSSKQLKGRVLTEGDLAKELDRLARTRRDVSDRGTGKRD